VPSWIANCTFISDHAQRLGHRRGLPLQLVDHRRADEYGGSEQAESPDDARLLDVLITPPMRTSVAVATRRRRPRSRRRGSVEQHGDSLLTFTASRM